MSFLAYLVRLRIDELPHGHFAQHAHEDPSLPDAQTWEELEAHLIGRKTDPVTITSGLSDLRLGGPFGFTLGS